MKVTISVSRKHGLWTGPVMDIGWVMPWALSIVNIYIVFYALSQCLAFFFEWLIFNDEVTVAVDIMRQ